MVSMELYIKGKVQGVFFRATAKDIADKMGITGEIENLGNGNVRARITGDEDRVNEFVEWCRKGPQRARVDKVSVSKTETLNFNDFKIIRK
jgi:acylphosphatase